ncbi:hypothetical protein Q4E93_22015 [Flavitalea sp. BT771]|uniref:hypothetical protein n=1 Tax=Flavitalea sp. BT771 TaxID=3063329 RepID=UPI0026E194AE|nr:hypothetical protein [Flavitalea sp. BT771]MDO6433303.1 hypothetical protein [Flavitalea sp. BT771]MDV6222792.1 hypothetical protein [Flavitalea sp. BT771]
MVQFPSPEATSLGLVGNLPVSMHTGKASVNIPVNTGNDKKMPLISLSYNTGGIQPDAHPGWVGNNWTLNAGGVVTRIMNFIPDETDAVGYYYSYSSATSINLPYSFSQGGVGMGCWNDLCTLADGCPDEFYVNADGLSGKFMIDNTGNFHVMDDPSIKIEIERINAYDYPRILDVLEGGTIHPFVGFTVTKNDGTRYRFGYARELIETSCNVVNNQLVGSGYATAWYLAQIIYPNGETVNYTYTSKVQNRTPSGNTQNYAYQISPLSNGDYDPWDGIGARISRTATFHAYLQSIESTSTRLDFYTSTTNELKNGSIDLGNWKRLDSVVVYNKAAAAREKSFAFTYDTARNKRLTLLSLTEKGVSGSLPSHQFVYNEVKLPPYQSAQVDLWGYYNNNQDSTSIPKDIWPEPNMPFYYTPNREPNPNTVGAGILTEIKYPTGGSVLFEYEPNDYSFFYDYSLDSGAFYFPVTWKWDAFDTHWILYKFGDPNGNGEVVQFFELTAPMYATISGMDIVRTVTLPPGHYDIPALQDFLNIPLNTADNVTYYITGKRLRSNSIAKEQGPGLRIKKIYHKSSDSAIDIIHEYIYSKDYAKPSYNPALSSGILGNRPNFVVFPGGITRGPMRFGAPQGPVAMTEGSPLGYSEVTEITKDKNGNILDFVTNKYTNFDTHPDDVPGGFGDGYIAVGQKGNRGYERGKLVESATYDQAGKMLKKVVNTYTFFTPSAVSHGVYGRKNYVTSPDNNIHADDLYMFVNQYFSTCKISSSTDTAFDQLTNNAVQQYSSYSYNQYKLPSTTTFRTSKGIDKKNVYRYPFDISSPIYDSMTRRNMLNYPVETIAYLDTNITGSVLNTYKQVIFNSDTMYLMDKQYKLEISSPLSSFTMFNGTGKDAHYSSTNIEATKYDSKGNLLEVKDQSGIVSTYLWGYNNQYPVAKITGSNSTTVGGFINQAILDNPATTDQQMRTEINKIRTGLSGAKALISTYTYKPLVGITSETDPRGKTKYYEYDGFGRLNRIRDQDQNIIKTFEYQYQASSGCGSNCYIVTMQTLSGTNTIGYPVGVFNVHGKLLDTASTPSRFVTLWNADTANARIGTLSAGGDPLHFNMTLNSGMTLPAGVTGCRYYKVDIASNKFDGVRNPNGAYVDFGDGTGMRLPGNATDVAPTLPPNTTTSVIASGEYAASIPYYIHTYPNSTLKTVTFYHSDSASTCHLDNATNPASSMLALKNLRGNVPQSLTIFGSSCYADSTMNTVAAISNWSSIHSVTYFNLVNGDQLHPNVNMSYAQDFMQYNPGLKKISTALSYYRTGYRDTTFKLSRLKSDWNTYFAELEFLQINEDHWSHEDLSGLRHLNFLKIIATTQNHLDDSNSPLIPLDTNVIDNILIQVATGAGQSVTNGTIILDAGGGTRSNYSYTAVQLLLSKSWTITINGITQTNP